MKINEEFILDWFRMFLEYCLFPNKNSYIVLITICVKKSEKYYI